MIKLKRTDSKNQDFVELAKLLNSYLKVKDGDEHDFYNQYNSIDMLNHVVVAYDNDKPVGCGAFKAYNNESVEVKRMFTYPKFRSKGIASKILKELENWSKEIGYKSCVLETGKRQTEAVAFYTKMNYEVMPNYGQYIGIDNSLCFKKILS